VEIGKSQHGMAILKGGKEKMEMRKRKYENQNKEI